MLDNFRSNIFNRVPVKGWYTFVYTSQNQYFNNPRLIVYKYWLIFKEGLVGRQLLFHGRYIFYLLESHSIQGHYNYQIPRQDQAKIGTCYMFCRFNNRVLRSFSLIIANNLWNCSLRQSMFKSAVMATFDD